MNTTVDNKTVYNTEKVVSTYTDNFSLFAAEKFLLNKYKNELSGCAFLDIGIGGGRTTHFIATQANEYHGVDYSETFVAHVVKEYKDYKHIQIGFGDARKLHQFKDGYFDFILFSFNGIDCVSFEDRKLVLNECFRLLKSGGHFWFSFHNIYTLPKLYSFQWPKNPFKWLKELKRSRTVRVKNGNINKYIGKDYCSLLDGADFFGTEVLYIKPSVQFQLLNDMGFKSIIFYDAQTGKELSLSETENKNIDWIYVDCIKP